MSITHWMVILLDNSIPWYSSSFLCCFFALLIKRQNQHKLAADMLISDPGKVYDKSLPSAFKFFFCWRGHSVLLRHVSYVIFPLSGPPLPMFGWFLGLPYPSLLSWTAYGSPHSQQIPFAAISRMTSVHRLIEQFSWISRAKPTNLPDKC